MIAGPRTSELSQLGGRVDEHRDPGTRTRRTRPDRRCPRAPRGRAGWLPAAVPGRRGRAGSRRRPATWTRPPSPRTPVTSSRQPWPLVEQHRHGARDEEVAAGHRLAVGVARRAAQAQRHRVEPLRRRTRRCAGGSARDAARRRARAAPAPRRRTRARRRARRRRRCRRPLDVPRRRGPRRAVADRVADRRRLSGSSAIAASSSPARRSDARLWKRIGRFATGTRCFGAGRTLGHGWSWARRGRRGSGPWRSPRSNNGRRARFHRASLQIWVEARSPGSVHAAAARAGGRGRAPPGSPPRRSDVSPPRSRHDLEPELGVRARVARPCGSRARSPASSRLSGSAALHPRHHDVAAAVA